MRNYASIFLLHKQILTHTSCNLDQHCLRSFYSIANIILGFFLKTIYGYLEFFYTILMLEFSIFVKDDKND
jgi:hypothetical protein